MNSNWTGFNSKYISIGTSSRDFMFFFNLISEEDNGWNVALHQFTDAPFTFIPLVSQYFNGVDYTILY